MKLLVLSLIINFSTSFGQRVIDVDNGPIRIPNQAFYVTNGYPVSTAKYVRLTSGSPYFSETWMKSTVYITDSTAATNVIMRLDLLDGDLVFMNAKKEEMISVLPAFQVTMLDTITNKKYIFIRASDIAGALIKPGIVYSQAKNLRC